ncbi:MAG: hypothetical protein NTZ48_00165 [Candidatus Omnitrophica bacterium]|nr:hypothetical protein [Candidatus Omnitrophota bacterium]
MKKLMVIAVTLVALVCFAKLSFAQPAKGHVKGVSQKHFESIKGKITSIDTAKSEVTLKEAKTGMNKTISVGSGLISGLKVGDEVRISLKSGSNVAEKVKVKSNSK